MMGTAGASMGRRLSKEIQTQGTSFHYVGLSLAERLHEISIFLKVLKNKAVFCCFFFPVCGVV